MISKQKMISNFKRNKASQLFGLLALLGFLGLSVVLLPKTNANFESRAASVTRTLNLSTTNDAWVESTSPAKNHGSDDTVSVKGTQSIAYLKFDITPLLGADIRKLNLSFSNVSGSGKISVQLVDNNTWSESNLTYSNKPSLGPTVLSFSPVSGTTTIDLTSVAGNIKNYKTTLVSVALTGATLNDVMNFSSKESGNGAQIVAEVMVVQPVNTPTPVATATSNPTTKPSSAPSTTPAPTGISGGTGSSSDGATGNSHAYGLWTPWVSVQTGAVVDTCSASIHNSYYVVGPDGKRYPTWHPPVDPATGCTFGHEHGYDPSKFAEFDRVKKMYAYDGVDGCPKDGVISACELNSKHTGIPFGYANEALTTYEADHSMSIMRHEDHYGHKIKYMNGVGIDQGRPSGSVADTRIATGVTCNFLAKIHMGVSTKDAFSNNLHEIMEYMHCTDGVEYSVNKLGKFGAAGEFLASCTGTKDENRDACGPNVIKTGFSNSNTAYPGTCNDGNRSILSHKCLEELMFVPSGSFSGNLYESWQTGTGIKDASGNTIVSTDMTIDVNDAIRNYDPTQPNNVGYNVNICGSKSPTAGYAIRGGFCDTITNYGRNPVPSWDSSKALTGTNRGMYFSHPWSVSNGGKSAYKLTNPFGENAVDTTETAAVPAGYIKQYVSPINYQWNKVYSGTLLPNNINIVHDSGNGTVHAPN